MNTKELHTFLVPAFQKSPYLEECLLSLSKQEKASSILISTSTPFDGLDALAQRFDVQLFVHGPNQGMSHDWNMGLSQVKTPWVTLAHQDDTYEPGFSAALFDAIESARCPLSLVFTDYQELVHGEVRARNLLLKIKQCLLEFGFMGRSEIASNFAKMSCLRFGSPIPCPSVSLNIGYLPIEFDRSFKVNMDWAAWIERAQKPGAFYWVRRMLMSHRLHENSETTEGLEKGYRGIEDLALLNQLWPHWLAVTIKKTYGLAYGSNKKE
jgi:hypothetical protein